MLLFVPTYPVAVVVAWASTFSNKNSGQFYEQLATKVRYPKSLVLLLVISISEFISKLIG